MDGPSAAEPDLLAPSWFRWLGVVLCVPAGLVVGLAGHGAQRTAGLLLVASAGILWLVGVALGAIKVRRRDRDAPPWKVLVATAASVVPGLVVLGAVPDLHHPHGALVRGANHVSALVAGVALWGIAYWAIRRSRQQG